MAGITNAEFAMKLIPYGFDTVTIGGYNTDNESIDACEKIIARGRKEFNYPKEEIYNVIENEVNTIKDRFDVTVSANLRGTTPDSLIEISKIKNLDIIEINCHCRQEELVAVGCGQSMLLKPDLEDYVKEVVKKSESKVSMKMRANVIGVDNLEIAKLAEECGVDYLHIDAMKKGVRDADFDLIKQIADHTNIFIIGNNSINSIPQAEKMLNAGANGISIARASISGKLNFDLNEIKI
jgi:TIM-barrel protein